MHHTEEQELLNRGGSARSHGPARRPAFSRGSGPVMMNTLVIAMALLGAPSIAGCATRGSSGLTTILMLGGMAMLGLVAFIFSKAARRDEEDEEESASGGEVAAAAPVPFDTPDDRSGDDDTSDDGGSDGGGDGGGDGGSGGD